MKVKEAMLVYNPGTDQVTVVPWPDYEHLSRGYLCSELACFRDFKELKKTMQKMVMFVTAYQAIVREEVDPKAMHNAMLSIDEYREHIAPDMQRPLKEKIWMGTWETTREHRCDCHHKRDSGNQGRDFPK